MVDEANSPSAPALAFDGICVATPLAPSGKRCEKTKAPVLALSAKETVTGVEPFAL